MTDSLALAAIAVLRWLAENSIAAFFLTVCVQISFIAIAADKLTLWNTDWSHRIWLSAVALVLGIAPLHVLIGGWPIHVPTTNRIAASEIAPPASQSADAMPRHDTADERDFAPPGLHEPSEIVQPSEPSRLGPNAHEITSRNSAAEKLPDALQSSNIVPQASRTKAAVWQQLTSESDPRLLNRNAFSVLSGLYLFGCLIACIRLLLGTARLSRWSGSGQAPLSDTWAGAVQAARDVGLRKLPMIRVADEIAMPLVFGVFRPVVLVPNGFDRWAAEEQRAVFLHEFMHIHRRDMLGQFMAQTVRTIYWFHPAAWFLDRRLTEARELATDRQVIAGGMEAGQYAASLLSIVSRVGGSRVANHALGASAVAMSASRQIEGRLKEILQQTPTRSPGLRLVGPCSIAVLVLLTALSTVRIEHVAAQDQASGTASALKTSPEPTEAVPTEQTAEAAERLPTQALADEGDLFSRIRDCDVLHVSGEKFGAIFTVSGQVVSPEGRPIEGATVLLRESSTSRVSSESRKYLHVADRHRIRAQDVFARTTSDQDGRFEFREIKSPAMPTSWSNAWRGDVIAAREDIGLGWLLLGDKTEKHRVDADMTIVLRPTTSVAGRFVSPEKTAIEGATITLARLVETADSWQPNGNLDLQMSQLTPRVQTDAEGQFHVTGLPEGLVAQVSTHHPAWRVSGALIATSNEVPLGIQQGRNPYLRDREILAAPAEMIADPGIPISGQVIDPDGKPIAGVSVSFASTLGETKTDQQGKFDLQVSSDRVERDRKQPRAVSRLYVARDMELGFLSRTQEVPVDEITGGRPVTIQLEKGVRVHGSVVTKEGKPMVNAVLRTVGDLPLYGGTTDAEGKYELLLPQAQHVIVVTTEEPGYAVPERSELSVAGNKENIMASWPHLRVDLSDGAAKQVPPIVVARNKPIQVIVSLPDGRPASGATAIIKDEISAPSTRVVDKSEAVTTNQLGRADLLPKGAATDKAFIRVTLTTADNAFGATVPLNQAVENVVNVVLTSDWMVEGRVLMEGRPVTGAMISIGEATPTSRTGGFRVSNFQHVVTDREGWYRASVPQGKEYSVRVQSLPGEKVQAAVGYRATPSGDGRLAVRDFVFFHGNQEIAGRVVNLQDKPVPGANVQVLRASGVQPDFWIGHLSESQSRTDNQGRFHLKKVPAGTYRLSISTPRKDNQPRSVSTMVNADAGDMDVEVTLDSQPLPQIPRLQPRRVGPVQPSSSQP